MIDSSVFSIHNFNPVADNKFLTRNDVENACNALFEPLLPYFSPGKARVQLDLTTSTWDRAACDLEGWARPLFGIVPMVAGGASFAYWDIYRTGLTNGTDPAHPEYWGAVEDMDQRHVEATAIGYALKVTPQFIWDPLDDTAKSNVATWLLGSRNTKHASCNHFFFRVFVDLGLKHVGIDFDKSMTEDYLIRLENMYIQDGWYRDGVEKGDDRRIDYYNAFAMHYYGLLYAKYSPDDVRRAKLFTERARLFAQHYQHWFADTGSNVPFGRSLIYRHCVVAFWGALALVDEKALPWGIMKGIYLRNLRWWSDQPISRHNDKLLSIGYAYPNQLISERYSAAGSPWWALKAFVPLALPATHPFWAAEEQPLVRTMAVRASEVSGMLFMHQPGHTVLLVAGPETPQLMRGIPEKYSKFAYSSRFGFSVESDPLGFKLGCFDSMIAFSDDDRHYRVREHCDHVLIANEGIYSVWHPWADTEVESWVISRNPWHLRIHRVKSPRKLWAIEGGFAAPRTDFKGDTQATDDNSAWAVSKLGDFSGIVNGPGSNRTAKVGRPHGNTSVMFPRTMVPQLHGVVEANEPTVFTCAVLADPDGDRGRKYWAQPPSFVSVEECEQYFLNHGSPVELMSGIHRDK